MEFSGQYLSYNEYMALGGTIDQTPFNLLEFEARRKINEKTLGRLKNVANVPQEVKVCVFALINSMSNYNETMNNVKGIASESTDGYSVSYVTGAQAQETLNNKANECNAIINTYLMGVVVDGQHLLYAGI